VIGVRFPHVVNVRNMRGAKSWSLFEMGFAAAALLTIAVSLVAVPGGGGLLGASLALVVIAIARIDAREFIIPNMLVVAALALGLCNAALTAPAGIVAGLLAALGRGAAFALLFFALQLGYRWLRRREGLGLGDVKLAAAGGTWLDWGTIPAVIEIAAAAALTVYLVSYLVGQRDEPLRLNSRLPFGLFLAPAIWLGWLLQSLSAPVAMGLSLGLSY
jgi:leader peptidase (prepilin peptidase) / N-methyltransferase